MDSVHLLLRAEQGEKQNKVVHYMETEKESEWDSRLTTSRENPYPLAPKDLVRKGLVTEKIYQNENRKFGRFCRQIMLAELPLLATGDGTAGDIEVLGAGLSRDLGWIATAVRYGFGVAIRDNSLIACQSAIQSIRLQRIIHGVKVTQTEVESGWKSGEIQDAVTSVYYASQFIQVQDKETMHRMMRHLGRFLGLRGKQRVLYLVHPRGEDNPPEKVEWGKTTPYFDEELRAPLEEGLNGKVLMRGIAENMHHHQHYTLFKCTAW
jgi:hypothetical protein